MHGLLKDNVAQKLKIKYKLIGISSIYTYTGARRQGSKDQIPLTLFSFNA